MLVVQGLVVLSEHKALRLYLVKLILHDLIVVLEGFGLRVVGLFHQHQKLPILGTHWPERASSEIGSRGVG